MQLREQYFCNTIRISINYSFRYHHNHRRLPSIASTCVDDRQVMVVLSLNVTNRFVLSNASAVDMSVKHQSRNTMLLYSIRAEILVVLPKILVFNRFHDIARIVVQHRHRSFSNTKTDNLCYTRALVMEQVWRHLLEVHHTTYRQVAQFVTSRIRITGFGFVAY